MEVIKTEEMKVNCPSCHKKALKFIIYKEVYLGNKSDERIDYNCDNCGFRHTILRPLHTIPKCKQCNVKMNQLSRRVGNTEIFSYKFYHKSGVYYKFLCPKCNRIRSRKLKSKW